MLITNLTGCNNNTKASVKRKKNEQNMQLFCERISFLEGEICTFTICNNGDVKRGVIDTHTHTKLIFNRSISLSEK